MTGFRSRESVDSSKGVLGVATQRGATSCLRKPFTPIQLTDAINASLRKTTAMNKAGAMNR